MTIPYRTKEILAPQFWPPTDTLIIAPTHNPMISWANIMSQTLSHDNIWSRGLTDEFWGRTRRPMRWTRTLIGELNSVVEGSFQRLKIKGDSAEVGRRFVDADFVGKLDEITRNHRRR